MKRLIIIPLLWLLAVTATAQFGQNRSSVGGVGYVDRPASSVNSLGINSSTTFKTNLVKTTPYSSSTGRRWGVVSTGRGSSGFITRPVMTSGVVSFRNNSDNDNSGQQVYQQFNPESFNDAVPDYEIGPIDDAVVPLLVLMGLLVAIKKLKRR
ncbi:MAG: hypothetical protein MJ002_05720 [Paludibacteraceae bacterium]|nr:hypothetical protein [Paludibacteraceae bacterium]